MKKICCLFFIHCCFAAIGMAQIQTGETIAVTNTESGKVRGFIKNDIYTYKGIPYATAKRFDAPQKTDKWEGIRSSMNWGPVAPILPNDLMGDEAKFVFDHDLGYTGEDCLVLNVWTPSISDNKKRPVLFWIHGGGYTTGSSQELPSYHGENLSKKGDVVVVSINHRLNVLGFLDLSAYGEQYKYSANHSILDIRMALEWVRYNIHNFGGDPNNVMIFGQSGGGAKVNNLMAMPSAKGLFHKAVNQSGAFRMTMLQKETTQKIAAEVLKELNLSKEQVDSLKNMPYMELAKAGQKALKTVESQLKNKNGTILGLGLDWGPSLDGALLPYQIYSEEALALSKDIPLMIGTVKNEFMPSVFTGMSNATIEQVKGFIELQHGDNAAAYMKAVKAAFPKDTKPTDLMDIDTGFRLGAVHQANAKSAVNGSAPVFMYFFSWQSPVLDGKYKAVHCMELPFVFDNIARCENMTDGGRAAHVLADKMSQAWINFARHGNPNHSGLPEWQPYTAENGTTLFFDNHCHIRHHHDKALLELLSN